MQILDQQGQLIRSQETLTALHAYIERELASQIDAITAEDSDWRVSGGAHLAGIWRATNMPVLIKLGMDTNQFYWTQQIAATAPDLMPQLFASGDRLGAVPINWTVMERVAYGSLGPDWHGDEFTMALDAAVRFQRAARHIEPHHTRTMDSAVLYRELEAGVAAKPPGPVATVMNRLADDWAWMASTCALDVCHGDVHMTNVITRTPPSQPSDALLIDCQPVRWPWAFDAAYLQVLNSIDRTRVGYRGLVSQIAHIRAAYGMSVCQGPDLTKVARLSLAWFAIRFWGLTPDRHSIADYHAETERYISETVS